MDVQSWLESMGLGQYAEAFAYNHVDDATLRSLSSDDLRELGVTSLGHRKRLLSAISSLAEPRTAPDGTNETERRQVAVLFADLCGFTELSTEVGAELAHRIVERFLATADEIVTSHGGSIDKHIGDAVMGLFGAPVAHEDDAWRAVAAAEALQRAMPALSIETGRPLATHIGIALGDVVAGAIGSTVRRDYTVLGDTVNLAARLVGAAGPGETMLSGAVYQAVRSRARATFVGERTLKGVSKGQPLWRLDGLGESGDLRRFPFLGRDVELAQIKAVVEAARPGAVLHLRGEAGIGKTRLLAETISFAEGRRYRSIITRIVDFGTARTQTPIRLMADALIAQLPTLLADTEIASGWRAALHDVLERPMPEDLSIPYAAMEDRKRTDLRVEAVVGLLTLLSRKQPLAIAVEDLHWANDSIRLLIRALARKTAEAQILLVTTSRPEGDPLDAAFRRDLGGASVVTVELGPLSAASTRRLAEAAATLIDADTIARFVERSGGNPLFIEQLALSSVESGPATLPTSIRGLVQARLDRLGRLDRAALQAASILGQRFPNAALGVMVGNPAYQPNELLATGLLVRDSDMLAFGHALIQEATYASLLGETTRRLHRTAANWYGDGDPDLRAQHLDKAGDPGAAAAYQVAAEKLRATGRLAAALERAERGLELLGAAGEGAPLALLAGHLRLDLGAPREALAHFKLASGRATNDTARAEADFGIAAALRITDDLVGAEAALDRAQGAAERVGLGELQSRCHHLRGNLFFPLGRVDECMREHEAALALAERAQSPELIARALGGLADAHYARGYMQSARQSLKRCIASARSAGAGSVEIANRPMAAFVECYAMELDAMREMAEAARILALQAQNTRAELIALHALMIVAIERMDPMSALPHVDTARRIVAELGAWRFESENVIFGAQLEHAAGNHARAVEMASEAVESCREYAMAYMGPTVLGIAATLTADPSRRSALLAEGDDLLMKPALAHSHLFFRSYAIEACLTDKRTDDVRRHARALAEYSSREPMPYSDFLIKRGMLLADALDGRLPPESRAELSEMAERAKRQGFVRLAMPMLAVS